MEKIIDKHSSNIILLFFSKLLERSAYYGLFASFVLYSHYKIGLTRESAIELMGIFTTSLVISQILGGLLGDLLLRTKKAILIGGFLQAIGTFTLIGHNKTSLYLGLFLFIFGTGLYIPNFIAEVAKNYFNKSKLMDAGFSIIYLAINLGGVFGPLLLFSIRDKFGWNATFITAGIMIILSVLFIYFVKDKNISFDTISKKTLKQRLLLVIFVLFMTGLFWTTYELALRYIVDLQENFSKITELEKFRPFFFGSDQIFVLPITILIILFWSYLYYNRFFKLFSGFIFATISFGLLWLIPENPSINNVIFLLIAYLFLTLADFHISTVILSLLAEYTTPKYLATIYGIYYLPSKVFRYILVFFFAGLYTGKVIVSLKFALAICFFASIMIGLFLVYNKKVKS